MPKIVDHDAYRKQLVEGCIELFAAHGYATLTIRKVASELGISTGTLYHYFPNGKQAIFTAVVERITQMDSIGSEALMQLDIHDRFDAVLAYVDANRERFEHHRLVLTEVLRLEKPGSPILESIRAATQTYILGITALLELPSTAAGRLLLGVINGVLFHDMLVQEEPTRFVDLAQPIRGMLIGLGMTLEDS